MADLKSPWANPPVPNPGLSGDGVTSSGSDPNAEGNPGPAGLQSLWPAEKQITTKTEIAESANSVSGLPSLPNRFEPGVPSTIEPPNLQDRSPANVDKA